MTDPANLPEGWKPPSSITGNVFITDAHQVWDVPQGIEHLKMLANIKPWFTEEPTAPDEYVLPSCLPQAFAPSITQMIRINRIFSHARIQRELNPTASALPLANTHMNRMVSKQPLQVDAVELFRLIRPACVNEVLTVLMATKPGKAVCPYASGVGLCEYVIHPSWV